ncbi:pyridoxal phosphate-dependent aminotransferase [Parabacteroides sp.]|uniref:pyridoxal phosphate-dependent aminotransferase n=1 Tax=Parabacteroides sp. TaxID=1869337 RepID=UPI0026DEAE10|nr:pyridoxal phosphate-dependent aminotransferase [Parabacteroides sp.]MDO5429829.1 pyridoxal phosphate-dependent aminotransferase [Parabacteroides sp.]
MIELSHIAKSIKPSLTRHLFNLAKEYDDVVDFTLGDPDIQPHQAIKDAGCLAIQEGRTRYSQNAGLLELRQTISRYYERKEGFYYQPENEIIATVGAMEGLYLSLLSILNPGDEVVIPAPYYVNYVQMVQMCHATPIIIDNPEGDELSFDPSDVETAITNKTKAIIINTPSNPSGRIIPKHKIMALAELSKRHNLLVISDEVYKCLIYDNAEFKSIVGIEGMRERTILVNSLSKEFCMTGWRIGYVLAPKEIIGAMTKLQENVAACASLPSQYAAIEALSGNNDYSANMVNTFTKRRNILVEGINSIPRLSCKTPDSTFYLMVDISKTGMKSEEFAIMLLKKVHVAVVPGITYGKSCDNYVRIAFTIKEDKIYEGIKRIRLFINQL